MRKRFVIPASYVVSGCVAVLILAACDGSRSEHGSPPPAVDGEISLAPAVAGGGRSSLGAPAGARTVSNQPRVLPATAASAQHAGGAPDRSFNAPLLPAGVDPSGAMLVRHGQASVEVKHVDDAVTKVRQTAAQFGGFVANTALKSGRDEQRSAILEIRVPTGQFEPLLASLSSLGKVESVAATAEDVGDEYVDLGARVANARRVEARLTEMLAARTGKLSDVLTVEQELRRVREEIERYDARLKWLERRTALSSLDVSVHEPLPLIERQPGPGPIAEAFAEAWSRAVGVTAWCIASLGVLLPLGVLALGVAVMARRLLRMGTPPGVSGA